MRKVLSAAGLALLASAALYLIVPLYATPSPAGAQPRTVLRLQVHVLLRISQGDEAQYASPREYATWARNDASCSAAAMAEVGNFYSRSPRRYRISDILHVEIALGAISPQLGLLNGSGIQATVARFGLTTRYLQRATLEEVIALANAGTPVIVSWPPSRYPGGHILVVTGGTASLVFLADSSAYNRRTLSSLQFLHWWAGFAAVVTPRA
jgi:Peptidase_C39 like family